MSLIETETCQAIIDRLKAYLPVTMTDSVLPYLDRPEELTEDVLTACHPFGLYLVQFVESVSQGGAEEMIFGVYTVAKGITQTNRLTRAAKVIVTGLKPYSGHALAMHEDKPVVEEGGVIMRCVSFRIMNPTVPIAESKLAEKITTIFA
jgi:hypothetical protein